MDVRVKFLFLIVANIIAFSQFPTPISLYTLTIFSLYLLSFSYKRVFLYGIAYLICVLPSLPGGPGTDNPHIGIILFFAHRYILVAALLSWFFRTTTSTQILNAMQAWRLPLQMWVPLAVVFRFGPAVRQEAKAIHSALKLRGLWQPYNLVTTTKFFLLPLINTSMRTADELSAATLTRGLGSAPTRTILVSAKLRVLDYLGLAAVTGIFIGYLAFTFELLPYF